MLKSGRGGKRTGSGRKPEPETKKVSYNTRLRPEHVAWLRSQPNAASVLERLIETEMKRTAMMTNNSLA